MITLIHSAPLILSCWFSILSPILRLICLGSIPIQLQKIFESDDAVYLNFCHNTVISPLFQILGSLTLQVNYDTMLKSPKPFVDPLGNLVQLPLIMSTCGHDYGEIRQVITTPAFIIQVKHEKIYFFRLITSEINMVVEATVAGEQFFVSAWMENPSTEYVSALLEKGSLISFQ